MFEVWLAGWVGGTLVTLAIYGYELEREGKPIAEDFLFGVFMIFAMWPVLLAVDAGRYLARWRKKKEKK